MKRILLCLSFLLCCSNSARAQTHYCDTTPPTSGNGVVGATVQVQFCNDGKDSTGTVPVIPTSFTLYDNNVGASITMTKGTTSAVSGKTVYTGNYIVPSAGSHSLQSTATINSKESAKSTPFLLTGITPTPSVPTNLTAQ